MSTLRTLAAAVVTASALATAAPADSLTASARLDPDNPAVEEPGRLIVDIACALERAGGPVGTPEVRLPNVPQLGLASDAAPIGQSVGTSMGPAGIRFTASYSFEMTPSEQGTFDLPPIAVTMPVGGRRLTAQTDPLTVVVGAGEAPRRQRADQTPPDIAGAGRPTPLLALAAGLMLAGAATLVAVLIFASALRRPAPHPRATIAPQPAQTLRELRELASAGDGDTFYGKARSLVAGVLPGASATATSAELILGAAAVGLSAGGAEHLAAVLENADHVTYGGAGATASQLETDVCRLQVVLAEIGDRARA